MSDIYKQKSIISVILSIFFPRICYSCGEVGSYLCDFCLNKKITLKRIQDCHVCKRPLLKNKFLHESCSQKTYLKGVVVALSYNKFVEHLIAEFKYEFVSDLKELFSSFIVGRFKSSKLKLKNFVVTYVPLTKSRERWRGYNQSKILAKSFSKPLGFEFGDLLERVKFNKSQVGLKRVERLKNVENSFVLKSEVDGNNVLIIDDVMTTGATLEECAKVLKKNGAKEIFGLVVARG